MVRWKLTMQEYNYTLKHISATENIGADILSRTNVIQKVESISEDFITEQHIKLIHPGPNKLYHTLKNNFPNITRNKIETVLSKCTLCKIEKSFNKRYGFSKGNLIGLYPNELISMDLLGPIKTQHFNLKQKDKNYFYIFAIIDNLTRFSQAYILYKTQTIDILKALEKWVGEYGAPARILSDRGPQFISKQFKNFTDNYKIQHILTSAHNPNGNGLIENANRTIGEALRFSRYKDNETIIENIHTKLNNTYQKTIRMLPSEAWYQINYFTKEPLNINYNQMYRDSLIQSNKSRELRNRKRISIDLRINDWVFLKNNSPDKMDPKFLGTFRIKDVSRNKDRYLLDENTITAWRNVKNLKL